VARGAVRSAVASLPRAELEAGGRLYEAAFRVRAWKVLLPDGAAALPRRLPEGEAEGARSGVPRPLRRETCRGELAHWITLAFAPVFVLWNPPWAIAVMTAYGILANVPCIVTQRYNRLRLAALARRAPA